MSSAPAAPPNAKAKGPLLPETYLDAPSQRLYYLSLGLLCQAIKLFDFIHYIASSDSSLGLCKKWLMVDFIYCVILSNLRIPRLNHSFSVVLLQIACLWFINGLLFGGVSLNFGKGASERSESVDPLSGRADSPSTSSGGFFDFLGLSSSYSGPNDAHLLGQHTVRMSPISTAQLNPSGATFCLTGSSDAALVPILLNNTNPTYIRYSLSSLDDTTELKAIEASRLPVMQVVKSTIPSKVDDDYDEYDDDEGENESSNNDPLHSSLQRTQALNHLRLTKPGRVRLDRVMDSSGIEARLQYPYEVLVAHCPKVQFVDEPTAAEMVNGRRESFLVEGIEGNIGGPKSSEAPPRQRLAYQSLRIPLSVSTSAVGTHVYALEEVSDAVGNIVRVGSELPSLESEAHATTTTRSFQVLRRSTMSFKGCGPGQPTALRIGGEAGLTLYASDADTFDLPLEVTVAYKPSNADGSGKRDKAWVKTLTTQEHHRELTLQASSPGEYTIQKVKGRYCNGDVLAPESCQVVERPLPSAEIEWKKIHECSGDTGVSASLVMHGTPPFQVHYRIQRDKLPAQDISKTFASSRGELTLQPERSGHYVFSFQHISDANYKKVDLHGPSIDQIIHSPASADFVGDRGAKNKRQLSSCEGASVDVEVELKGSGPWTLEIQIVGPKSSETMIVRDIETPRKTIQVPIPHTVDKQGGTFEIDLVSVEDKYKCKRPVQFPPTVKFYGENGKRHVTVLENEKANLPMRLTGDGPWRVRYHRLESPQQIFVAKLDTPNSFLGVTDKGMYEIIERCLSAFLRLPIPNVLGLSLRKAQHTAWIGYRGPPICQGMVDHVDLDLSGRPPFEIMYNIAQNSDTGGTKLIDQPTFNSIQPHTRLQLQTSNPGRVYYEVKQIGDASNAVIPRSERLLFEQQVSMRPSAYFKNRNRIPYCLNDQFIPLDHLSSDGTVIFEGTPPFRLRLTIKNVASSLVDHRTVETYSPIWKIDLPSFEFQAVGPYLIVIDSVSDASGCDHASLDPLGSTIWVDVAETAAILPFDRREDYCVGDVAQFQLEGIPPWSISYKINGRAHVQEAKTSPFSLAQLQPGEFTITSISHQQKMCKAAVTDLHFNVGHGKRIYQDIHEGDQAEILFTLIGEPPFTFTYQRSEPVTKKGGKPGKVLETHTVSRIYSKEYAIYSALEGTWTVTSISDRYCRYPPAQPDAALDKQKR
ncbi:hypothetical protein CPB85DRAFT_1247129 [Mucidula mucida]|nr:hypothetical protein CPB85DRAFT_1247129 [Mucidula mucida]